MTAGRRGCSASSCEILLPFLKECRAQLKCEWGTCTFHHIEIVLWAWGSSLFYSFTVNELQVFTQYHFRLEKQKKKKKKKKRKINQKKPTPHKQKGAKTPQMLVPCPADVAWTAPTWPDHRGGENMLSRRCLTCSHSPEGWALCQAVLFGNMMVVSATLNLSFLLLPPCPWSWC